jgi:hypothetical protein
LLLGLGIILLVVWALCFLAFHVTAGVIHLLIILGIIAIIVHFVRGSKTRVP